MIRVGSTAFAVRSREREKEQRDEQSMLIEVQPLPGCGGHADAGHNQ